MLPSMRSLARRPFRPVAVLCACANELFPKNRIQSTGIPNMTATKLAVAVIALGVGFITVPAAHAAITPFTNRALFNSTAAGDGITINTNTFAGNAVGTVIPNGGTLNSFTYSFDPTNNAPGVALALDGSGHHALGDTSLGTDPNLGFGQFVGGENLSFTHNGGSLLAFGALFLFDPSGLDVPAAEYNLTIQGTANTVGNLVLPANDNTGSFFLGFIGQAGDNFGTIDMTSVDDPNFLVPAFQISELDFGPPAAAAAVPEPASIALLGGALLMAGAFTRRRTKR
jgi:hypothetical protein